MFGDSLPFPMNFDAFLLFLINELEPSHLNRLRKVWLSLWFVLIRYIFISVHIFPHSFTLVSQNFLMNAIYHCLYLAEGKRI